MAEENKSIASLAKVDLTVSPNTGSQVQAGVGIGLSPDTPVVGDKLANAILETTQQVSKAVIATNAVNEELEDQLFTDKVNQMRADMVANGYDEMDSAGQKEFLDKTVQSHHEELERSERYDKKLGVFYVNSLDAINAKEAQEIKATQPQYINDVSVGQKDQRFIDGFLTDIKNVGSSAKSVYGKDLTTDIHKNIIESVGVDMALFAQQSPSELMKLSEKEIRDKFFGQMNKLENLDLKDAINKHVITALNAQDAIRQTQGKKIKKAKKEQNDAFLEEFEESITKLTTATQSGEATIADPNYISNVNRLKVDRNKIDFTGVKEKKAVQIKNNMEDIIAFKDAQIEISGLLNGEEIPSEISLLVKNGYTTKTKSGRIITMSGDAVKSIVMHKMRPIEQQLIEDPTPQNAMRLSKFQNKTGVKSELYGRMETSILKAQGFENLQDAKVSVEVLKNFNHDNGVMRNKLFAQRIDLVLKDQALPDDQKLNKINSVITNLTESLWLRKYDANIRDSFQTARDNINSNFTWIDSKLDNNTLEALIIDTANQGIEVRDASHAESIIDERTTTVRGWIGAFSASVVDGVGFFTEDGKDLEPRVMKMTAIDPATEKAVDVEGKMMENSLATFIEKYNKDNAEDLDQTDFRIYSKVNNGRISLAIADRDGKELTEWSGQELFNSFYGVKDKQATIVDE